MEDSDVLRKDTEGKRSLESGNAESCVGIALLSADAQAIRCDRKRAIG
jgi:hypothetical protein